jgi:hypothetical protein
MRHLIIGHGQIGQAVDKMIRRSEDELVHSYDIAKNTEADKQKLIKENAIDILHITFPYTDKFIVQVKTYIKEFKPQYSVIYSTVKVGTTRQFGQNAFYSPVVGRHPNLYEGILYGLRFIGTNQKSAHPVDELWEALGARVKVVDSTDATEFIKIRSTAKFGINLVWTEYEKSVADDIGVDFNLVKEFDEEYNKLYQRLGMEWAQQYILDPPGGVIGGHCVIPNALLLQEQYPSDLLGKIIAMRPKKGKHSRS